MKTKKSTRENRRALIYFRQSVVARWLGNGNAVFPCFRWGVPHTTEVNVINRNDKAHYENLQTCKRSWLCPICANRISARRRAGMERAIEAQRLDGQALVFVTYTVQHDAGDSLLAVRDRVQSAHVALHSGKQWQRIERAYDWGGSIKSVEITYTEAGWHWHLHEIGFVGDDYDLARLRDDLDLRWRQVVANAGGYAKPGIGLVIKAADAAVRDYVSKWGIVPELAPGNGKGAKGGGVLPFQFPDMWLDGRKSEDWARQKYLEYAGATKGVKQLWASPSVRPYMAKPDVGERELETSVVPQIIPLTHDQWRAVWKSGKRATLLAAVEAGDLTEFLSSIKL